jgi:hypothetical protein
MVVDTEALMNPGRQWQAWRLACVTLFSALMLLGCSQIGRTVQDQIPTDVTITPAVPIAQADLARAPKADETDFGTIPQPRMKPTMPRSLRAKLASAVKRPAPPAKAAFSDDALAAQESPAPTVAPDELVGSDFSTVRDVLRQPDYVQYSALTVVWAYSGSGCTLRLFFYPDIQTRRFHVLKYDLRSAAGDKMSDGGACMQHLAVTKNDDPAQP